MTGIVPLPLTVDLARWPGVVLRLDRDGTILASNGRLDALLGVEVTGRGVGALLEQEASLAKWERLARDGDAAGETWELIFCAADRVLEPGAYSVVCLAGEKGYWLVEHPRPPRLAELASEVAEVNAELTTAQRSLVMERARLARALAELERSNRALDEFAHVVSHDLKAPVRAIREYAELLVEESIPSSDEERESYLRRIHDLTGRMQRMINAALAYARAGRSDVHVEEVDVGLLVKEVIAFLAPPADVRIEVAAGLPTVQTDRVPLEQVLRNLLSNAITYGREEDGRAHVTVSAADRGDAWELVVADSGPGIAEGQQERIWRLFHTSRPGEGTGLGLALVKRLVESLQGTVTVRSAPGEGAAFHVRWPKRPSRPPVTRGAAQDAESR